MSKFIKQSNTITEKMDIVGINKQPYYIDIDILVGVNSIIKNSHIVSSSSSITSQQIELLYIINYNIDDDINPNNNLMIINSYIPTDIYYYNYTFKIYNSYILRYKTIYMPYSKYGKPWIICNYAMMDVYLLNRLLNVIKKLRAI